jgi:dienelactone hydrolase
MRSCVVICLVVACGTTGGAPSGPSTDGGTTDGRPSASHEIVVTAIPELPGSRLFVRPDAIPAPGILMLHGSEGGSAPYIDDDARPLAEAGFAVVTFCWFGCAGRPNRIYHIPLEDTLAGIAWLRGSAAVGGRRVGLYGVSRGAEQAVLLASLEPSAMASVGVHAPSDTIVASYDPATEDGIYEQDPSSGQWIFAAAWTWKGSPLYGEKDSFSTPGPRIRVEDYPSDMYLSHGVADTLWPVQRSRNIEASRTTAGRPTEAHYWDGQDHILMGTAAQQFITTLTAYYHRTLD